MSDETDKKDEIIDYNGFITGVPTYTGTLHGFYEAPLFPFTITLNSDISITLHSDGKWEGDIVAVKRAMVEWKGQVGGVTTILMWLVLRQMIRDDERFW
jgi:hypothetical protein